MCDFGGCNCHPGAWDIPQTVDAVRYPLMSRCYLSSMLSSFEKILQDVNRKTKSHV